MARRTGAFLGILLVVGLLLALVWQIYEHHLAMHEPDEAAVVHLDVRGVASVENFARSSA